MFSTAFLLAASMVVGQAEKANVPDDAIEELSRLIGTWQMTGKEGSDIFMAKCTNEWAPGQYGIRLQCTWSGAWEGRGFGFVAWDNVKKELFGPEAYEDGSVCRLHYNIRSPGVWEGETHNSLGGKGEYKAEIRLEFKNADHYTWSAKKATLNGQPYPDMELEFKRVK
jgi:hypothetical protein